METRRKVGVAQASLETESRAAVTQGPAALVTWGRVATRLSVALPEDAAVYPAEMRLRRPQQLSREETEQAVRELGWWHHHFELPNGVRTGDDSTAGYDPAERWEPDDVVADDFPRLSFVEGRYRGDVTNWWLPNYTALAALARSAGLRILARPTPELLVTEPARKPETVRRRNLVFPKHDVPFDEAAWNDLRAGTF